MPLINVRIAAQLTGKDRSTIIRAIEDGRLSASKDDRGRYRIDPAELERVYGPLRSPDAPSDVETDVVPQTASVDTMRAAALKREVDLLREIIDKLERERSAWQEERTFLRDLVTRHTEQIKLLTDQREKEPHSPSLFRWFRRKS